MRGMKRLRVLDASEVDRLRDVEALHREAEQVLEAARREAERLQQEMVAAARERTLADATRAAARVIAEAEGTAERRLRQLEPTIARLVSGTVAEVIGEMDRADAVERATRRALERLRGHRRARIAAAPDVIAAVRSAVAGLGAGAEIVGVETDDRLEAGRVVLTSDDGHAEIGLSNLVAEAVRPFSVGSAEAGG